MQGGRLGGLGGSIVVTQVCDINQGYCYMLYKNWIQESLNYIAIYSDSGIMRHHCH